MRRLKWASCSIDRRFHKRMSGMTARILIAFFCLLWPFCTGTAWAANVDILKIEQAEPSERTRRPGSANRESGISDLASNCDYGP